MAVNFACCDCSADVRDITADAAPVPPRCMVCEWIAREIDPADYAIVRSVIRAIEPGQTVSLAVVHDTGDRG